MITRNYRKNSQKRCEYDCVICGHHGDKVEKHIIKGIGCPVCSGKLTEKGINDITVTDPWMIPFFQGGEDEASQYSHRSHKEIYPICPFCGTISKNKVRIDDIWKCRGFSCACKDSITFPNKVIYALMDQLYNLGYIQYFQREYGFSNLKSKYDMYFEFNNNKYLVEMDGGIGHGHEPTINKMSAKESLSKDQEKDKIASQHNCNMIRINSTISDINIIKDKILKSELSKLFDLNVIDWNKILEFTCRNIVKDVCDYKSEHEFAFSSEISKKFHIGVNTVIQYLKKGTELGWCNYNGKDEMIRSNTGTKKGKCISVTNIKTNEEYCFKSYTSLEKESLDKFGIKITIYCIKNNIINNPNYYNDYYIKPVSNDYYDNWENNIKKENEI